MDWLGDLGRDVRHAVRSLRRNLGSAPAVALILALGLGAIEQRWRERIEALERS